MWKQPVSHKYRSVSVTMKKKGAIIDEAVCPCTQRWWLYLTTSIELAPDLKKSVESSITGTLLKIRAQMTCTEKATFIKKGCVESQSRDLFALFPKTQHEGFAHYLLESQMASEYDRRWPEHPTLPFWPQGKWHTIICEFLSWIK